MKIGIVTVITSIDQQGLSIQSLQIDWELDCALLDESLPPSPWSLVGRGVTRKDWQMLLFVVHDDGGVDGGCGGGGGDVWPYYIIK